MFWLPLHTLYCQNSVFETCIKHIKCSLLRITHALKVLCVGIVIYLFIYSANLWAQKVDRLCTTEEAGFLHYKFLCWDHFLPTDFTTTEGTILNILAVPCSCDLCPSTSTMHKIAIASVYVAGQQCVKQYVMSNISAENLRYRRWQHIYSLMGSYMY